MKMFSKYSYPERETNTTVDSSNPLIQFYSGKEFIGKICEEIKKFYNEELFVGMQHFDFSNEESIIIAISSAHTQIVHVHRRILKNYDCLKKESIQIGVGKKDNKLVENLRGKNLASTIYALENSWIKNNKRNMLISTSAEHIATYHMNMQHIDNETLTIHASMLNKKENIMHHACVHAKYKIPFDTVTGKLGMLSNKNRNRHIYATYSIEGRLA